MGVLECRRRGCEHIMCRRYSDTHGYICDECFEELVESGPETSIETFMSTKKRGYRNREAARARFNVEFPLSDTWGDDED